MADGVDGGRAGRRAGRRPAPGRGRPRNGEVVPRSAWDDDRAGRRATRSRCWHRWREADRWTTTWSSPDEKFASRLLLGTGGVPSLEVLERAIVASGTELVTVALRRVEASTTGSAARRAGPVRGAAAAQHGRLLHRPGGGAHRAAGPGGVRHQLGQARGDRRRGHAAARPGRAARRGRARWWPTASPSCRTRTTTRSSPGAWPTSGCAAVMPLGSPIGSGLGIRNPHNIALIREAVDGAGGPGRRASAPRRTRRWRWSWAATRCCWPPAVTRARDPERMADGHAVRGRGRPAGQPGRADPAPLARRGVHPDARTARPVTLPRLLVLTDRTQCALAGSTAGRRDRGGGRDRARRAGGGAAGEGPAAGRAGRARRRAAGLARPGRRAA